MFFVWQERGNCASFLYHTYHKIPLPPYLFFSPPHSVAPHPGFDTPQRVSFFTFCSTLLHKKRDGIFFFLNIRESSYKNKTLFLDSACRITPQIHSLRDTNSSDQRKNFLPFFPCFRFFLLNIYLKKEEFYFLLIPPPPMLSIY